MTEAKFSKLMQDESFRREVAAESFVLEAAEQISLAMKQQGVNKAELARKLGKSRAWVTQMLDGSANMTLRTLADVLFVLNQEPKLILQGQGFQAAGPAVNPKWDRVEFNGCVQNEDREDLFESPEDLVA